MSDAGLSARCGGRAGLHSGRSRSSRLRRAPPAPAARFVVVLDAAHGGDDAGGRLGTARRRRPSRWRSA